MAEHTPGPWRASGTTVYGNSTTGEFHIATAISSQLFISNREQEANAHLIAVAPDLLAAAVAAHNAIDILFAMLIEPSGEQFFPSKSGAPWEALLQLNAAIANARGEA